MRALVVALTIFFAASTAAADPDIAALKRELDGKRMTDPAGAVAIARKIYEAQKKAHGEDHYEATRAELDLGSVLSTAGDYTGALEVEKHLLAIEERLHGPDSDEVKQALTRIAGIYWMRGDVSAAEPTYQRILAITRKAFGDKSERYAMELQQYASYLERQTETTAAQQAYERALAIFDATKSASTRGLLNLLGLLYIRTGQHPKAIAAFDRVLELAKTEPAAQRISSMAWIAQAYRLYDRDDLARPLSIQAIALGDAEIANIEKAKGPDDPSLSSILFSVGDLAEHVDDLAKAEAVFARQIKIDEKRGFPPYGQLAMVRRLQRRPKDAIALFEQAQANMNKLSRGNPRQMTTGLNPVIGDLYREVGDYARAEKLYVEGQADLDRYFGKSTFLVIRLHLGLVNVLVASKQIDKAERVLADNLEIAERELQAVLGTGTEADHLAYFARETHQLDYALGFNVQIAPKRASATRLALTTLLRRKGRILDAAAASVATMRGKLSPDDRKLLDQLGDARARMAKLVVAGAAAKDIAALDDEIKKLEVQLATKSAAFKVAHQPIDLASVQAKIPHDARLVELASYVPKDWKAADVPRPKPLPRRYVAYVLADRGDPVVVDLGDSQPIDDAIAKFRKALGDPDNAEVANLSRAVHALTFAKIAPALGGAKQVLVAPDGALNLVPFAALHDGKRWLVEDYTFTYLTSGRDLLRLAVRGKAQGGTIIFADPDFDGTAPAPSGPGTRGAAIDDRRSRAMSNLSWPRLPGTAAEADAIIKDIKSPTVFRDKLATETAVKTIHAPAVLHLATHGFFLPDGDDGDNPLLHAGLAFAGANKLSSGSDDGILTALEASGLDLWGTKLVVMSACETGLGKITNGDGVYGLRRALVIAGAESLVMSLWQVDDAATRDLMSGYYRKLGAGKGRSAALREVQLEIHGNAKYAHPYYWASFVAAGDSGPL